MTHPHVLNSIHHAPAGSSYESLSDAGSTLLREKYTGFLEGTANALLPPIFVNKYPEQIGKDGTIKPGSSIHPNDTQLKGITINKLGDDFEASIYQRFEQFLHPCLSDSPVQNCHILWKGFTIYDYKMEALLRENPELNQKITEFRKKYTTKRGSSLGEADIVILVKYVGVVVIEIKRPLQKLKKGKQQCQRMAVFSSLVFESCGTSTSLPIVKVVILGEPSQGSMSTCTSPFLTKDEDVWVLYKEASTKDDNFQNCWNQILHDLQQAKSGHNTTSQQFDEFTAKMTGLWRMVSFNGPLTFRGKFN